METKENNNMMIPIIVGVIVVLLAIVGGIYLMQKNNSSNTQNGVMVGGALMTPDKDIIDNALNADNVTTLVTAVKSAGLVDTLKGAGPFTVFAPTNDAFSKLPTGTVDTLVKAENKAKLVDILTYHVVAGKYKSSDLTDGQMLTSLEGQKLLITKSGSNIMVNGAIIQTSDVISSNGVTHVIDTVLMPKDGVMVGGALMTADLNIVQNALNANNVTILVSAVKQAGLIDTLSGVGPFTVFAPTNDTFNKLPAGTLDTLMKNENKTKLIDILTYHVVAGKYKISDLTDGQVLKTVQGKTLTVKKNGDVVMINGATIQTKDIISSNGVTHIIDSVLQPK